MCVSKRVKLPCLFCAMKMMIRFQPLLILFFLCSNATAQHTMSIDAAMIRNMRQQMNGMNLSCFWHFNEKLTGGVEVNRFFPVNKVAGEEMARKSAWDIDLNFHYLVTLRSHLKFYPVVGISHTAEKETVFDEHDIHNKQLNFWSANAGAGLLFQAGKWAPHIEYTYTWGHINQQFLLAGITYEIQWGHHGKKAA